MRKKKRLIKGVTLVQVLITFSVVSAVFYMIHITNMANGEIMLKQQQRMIGKYVTLSALEIGYTALVADDGVSPSLLDNFKVGKLTTISDKFNFSQFYPETDALIDLTIAVDHDESSDEDKRVVVVKVVASTKDAKGRKYVQNGSMSVNMDNPIDYVYNINT